MAHVFMKSVLWFLKLRFYVTILRELVLTLERCSINQDLMKIYKQRGLNKQGGAGGGSAKNCKNE